MTKLNLTPNHKSIRQYYEMMHEKKQMGFQVEGNVAPAFADLLGSCAKTLGYRLNEQHPLKVKGRHLRLDGAILNLSNLRMGVWEAKDTQDDLKTEIRKKFDSGYPKDNILFQSPERAILIQNGDEILDVDLNEPHNLINILNAFFSYTKPAVEEWEAAVTQFKDEVPQVAAGLDKLIEQEYTRNGAYKAAFDSFFALCKTAINPNLSKDAVEEMLIQHILTERIFRRVFNNDKFTRQNAIARDIETVIDALTSKVFNRDDFTRSLDHFYGAIEHTASTISDYNEKQDFLNTVYEQFFQGFSVKVSDTHGIVYTPQAIVQFMVKSVEDLLRREFGRSLADEGVHILDPFVGTGNFILRVMEEIRTIKPSALPQKYANELHCNEIMLLPYYIASMNLEHAYYDAMGEYAPFEGICLVDTFELAEERQLPMFVEANTARVERQRKSELTVIIGNPPYNARQVNENDNNKNRKYKELDRRVRETYIKASTATNRNALSDPYVKAFRWASDRLKDEGVIAFVTNNSFIDNIAFDGMRQHLARDFSRVYIVDLKGNVRKDSMRDGIPIGEANTVFGLSAMVGVSITFLVKNKKHTDQKIFYYDVDWRSKRVDKFRILEQAQTTNNLSWQTITPTSKHLWLTEGMQDDYETLLPMGTKAAKQGKGQAIFEVYSNGLKTNRDTWAYNFRRDELEKNIQKTIETYNLHVLKWRLLNVKPKLDDFVENDNTKISWSRDLKLDLKRGNLAEYDTSKLRRSLYRPFTQQSAYFDKILNEEVYQFSQIFPTPETESENRVIVISDIGYRASTFSCLISNTITDVHLCASVDAHQCFPLYVYDAVGDDYERRDNISDWALSQFQTHYGDTSITKQDIFYYIYALLHHPEYRRKYAQNLKRELPRVGFIALTQPSPEGRGLLNAESEERGLSDESSQVPLLRREKGLGDEGDNSDRDYRKQYVSKALIQISRELRQRETPAEDILWEALRNRRLADAKFRRQHPIEQTTYVVDFYCHTSKLIVELDGSIHLQQKDADTQRQQKLESLGYQVLRFPNEGVYSNLEGVLEAIVGALTANTALTQPSPENSDIALTQPSPEERGLLNAESQVPLLQQAEDNELSSDSNQIPLLRREKGLGDEGLHAEGFFTLADIGRKLADLHLNYESAPCYALTERENKNVPVSFRVEKKMALSKDKSTLKVNEFLTLEGIPSEAFSYKLGNRSALEWVIEQYQVSTDKRSGITNDPNRLDDERYIVRLVSQVVYVSLETMKLVNQIAAIPLA